GAGAGEGREVEGEGGGAHGGVHRAQPAQEAALEGVGVQPLEDPLEGVVAGDAVGQGQEPSQPLAATPGEGLDLGEVVGPADDGTDGDDEEVPQQRPPAAEDRGGSPGEGTA